MSSFFRKLSWLMQRRSKGRRAARRTAVPPGRRSRTAHGGRWHPEEAFHASRRELGNLTLVKENTRAAWGWTLVEQFCQDLRYAFRTMAANRLFTALAVLLRWRWASGPTRRSTASWMPSCCARCRWPIPIAGGAELARQKPERARLRRAQHDGSDLRRSQVGRHERHFPLSGFRTLPEERFGSSRACSLTLPIQAGAKSESDQSKDRPRWRAASMSRATIFAGSAFRPPPGG